MLQEYDVPQDTMTLYCDNMSFINISKSPVQHSRTMHIDIIHHFIRDLVDRKQISLEHINTKNQLVDISTKALDATSFEALRAALGLCILQAHRLIYLAWVCTKLAQLLLQPVCSFTYEITFTLVGGNSN